MPHHLLLAYFTKMSITLLLNVRPERPGSFVRYASTGLLPGSVDMLLSTFGTGKDLPTVRAGVSDYERLRRVANLVRIVLVYPDLGRGAHKGTDLPILVHMVTLARPYRPIILFLKVHRVLRVVEVLKHHRNVLEPHHAVAEEHES